LGPILTGQWLFRFVRGELEQADKHVEEIRKLGEALNDSRCAFFSSTFGGVTRCSLGKFVDARIQFDNAWALWDPAHRAFTATPDDPYLQASLHHSRTLLCLGYVHQASLWRDNALAEARRLSPYNLVFALFHAWVGDWAMENVQAVHRTFRSAEEVLVISGEQGLPLMQTVGNIMQGWCLGSTGRAQEAIPLLLGGIARLSDTGCHILQPFLLTTLAEVYGMAAQPEEGLNRLAEAEALIQTTQERWAEAELQRLRGTLLLSLDRRAPAEESYCRALAAARAQRAKFWELRAATNLARLWRDQSKRAEARDLLAPIYGWFTEGFDTPVLQDAKALLDELA
jgi:tetratricopeptide (TPR) repeat protein